MKRRIASIVLAVFVTGLICPAAYAEPLTIDGMSMEIPDGWTESGREVSDDSTKITYSCGDSVQDGTLTIFITPYDDSIAEYTYLLLDAFMSNFEDMDGYTLHEKYDNPIDGRNAHMSLFTYQKVVGMVLSVDTGMSIVNCFYACPADSTGDMGNEFINMVTGISFSEPVETGGPNQDGYTQYAPGMYKVGTDIPGGEYMVFASEGSGYFCVSSDSNQMDILYNDNFGYNSIITINDGEYLDLSRCYAVPMEEEPEVDITGEGMFKVGVHIPAGEYKLVSDSGTSGYYCIYPSSRQNDIISNDNFEGQNYVTVTDGQYLVLSRCRFAEPPEKPVKTYTDADTVKKVQEALNSAGYDCGTPDGIAGSGTKAAIEKYQTDKGITVTGTITDELIETLGI